MRQIYSALLFVLLCTGQSHAIAGSEDGTEIGYWRENSIIVCEILENDITTIKVDVLAVVATDRLIPTILDLHVPGVDSHLKGEPTANEGEMFLPKKGEMWVFCVYQQSEDGKTYYWLISPQIIEYFDSSCGAQKVSGLRDERLKRLLARIEACKTKSREKEIKEEAKRLIAEEKWLQAEEKATTRPAR